MKDRVDFRLKRLEKRVFGTDLPTAGTAGGASITSRDLITRIVDLEAQTGSAYPLLVVSAEPSSSAGSNGQWAYDSTNEHIYVKLGGTWRQVQ